MQRIAALTVESSTIQTNISDVLKHLIDMETGQRGYLLTGDSSYLQPYTEAKSQIATDFATLRAGLAHRDEHELSLELQLESLAKLKQAEMERTISLREDGYRRRAFKLVDAGEGKGYMDKARAVLSSFLAEEGSISAGLHREESAAVGKARITMIATNFSLLVITACLFALARLHGQGLEKEATESRQELTIRDLHLQKLTATLSDQARFKTSTIEANACLLLQEYGGFLPRVGHECAEQIKEAATQMERLRQDLVGSLESEAGDRPAYESVA